MSKNRKKHLIQSQEYYDIKTGEKHFEIKTKSIPAEPAFVKMYIDDISLLSGLCKNGNNVLRECMKLLDYDGEIVLPAAKRQRIAENIGVTDRTVKNQLAILTKKGIFKLQSQMIYKPDPKLFAKGEWKRINKMRDEFELTIEYKRGKRKIRGRQPKIEKTTLKAVD